MGRQKAESIALPMDIPKFSSVVGCDTSARDDALILGAPQPQDAVAPAVSQTVPIRTPGDGTNASLRRRHLAAGIAVQVPQPNSCVRDLFVKALDITEDFAVADRQLLSVRPPCQTQGAVFLVPPEFADQ